MHSYRLSDAVTKRDRPGGSSLSAGAVAVAGGALLTRVGSLIVTVMLARSLSTTDFGGYQQLLLIVGILSPLLLAGVPAALTYFLARTREDAEQTRFTFDAYVVLSGLGVFFAAVVILTRGPIADAASNPDLATALPLFAPYILFTFIAAVMPSALITTGWPRRSAFVSALAAGVLVAVMIPAGILAGDLDTVALGLTVSSAITGVISMVAVARTVGLSVDWSGFADRARQFLGYGYPIALVGIAGTLGYQFDRLVVTSHFSTHDFAIYAAGAVELPFVPIIQQSVNSLLLPELTRRYRDGDLPGVHDLWREAVRKTSLVLMPIFVFSLLFAADIIAVLYGPRYGESTDLLRVYLLLMPIRVATYGLIPMAIGRPRINLAASLVYLGSNAVLALALVGPLGLVGPAVATVLADIVIVSFYLIRLRSILDSPISVLFPWGLVVTNLGLSAVASGVLLPFWVFEAPSFVTLSCGCMLYSCAYVALMRFTGRITDEDWVRLIHAGKRLLLPRQQSGAGA
jgi:O-antigen/teichoic acid export membrane protein